MILIGKNFMTKRILSVAAGSAAMVFSSPVLTWACSVCFTGTGDAVTDGFNASVLFLMVTPYAVVGSIVGGLVFAYRRALRKRTQSDSEPIDHFAWIQEDSLT
jgi:nitrate reductase gamma subunit